MNDVAAFVLARLAEREQAAQAAYDEASDYRVDGSELAELHFVLHKPDQVLAEVAALRAVVEMHHPVDQCDAHDAEFKSIPCDTLLALAGIWDWHPDYDPAWG